MPDLSPYLGPLLSCGEDLPVASVPDRRLVHAQPVEGEVTVQD